MFKTLRAAGRTIGFMVKHPVGKRAPVRVLGDWLRWQVGSRLVPGPVVVEFVGPTVLVAERGMTGATGNIYTGLHEFADMGFLLHFLKAGDTFGDVGANVGSYTILAAGVRGAASVAVEPIVATAEKLRRNLGANKLTEKVRVEVCCVGAADGFVRMISDQDTTNRVAEADGVGTVEVPMRTLDGIFAAGAPTLLKIDVEGFEAAVLAGAENTLSDSGLEAVIIEVTGDAAHEKAIGDTFKRHGFSAVRYDPVSRIMTPIAGPTPDVANTIFIRDFGTIQRRVADSLPFVVKGLSF